MFGAWIASACTSLSLSGLSSGSVDLPNGAAPDVAVGSPDVAVDPPDVAVDPPDVAVDPPDVAVADAGPTAEASVPGPEVVEALQPVLWLTPASIEATGSDVTRWRDESGKANHALPPVGFAPTLRMNALRGQSVVAFDKTKAQRLVALSSPTFDFDTQVDFSVVLVFQAGPNDVWAGLVAQASANAAAAGWHIVVKSAAAQTFAQQLFTGDGGKVVGLNSSLDVQDSKFRIVTTTFERQAQTVEAFADGAGIERAVTTALAASLSNGAPLMVGASRGSNYTLDGEIAEVIVVATALTSDDRRHVETYLSNKYGIATLDNPTP